MTASISLSATMEVLPASDIAAGLVLVVVGVGSRLRTTQQTRAQQMGVSWGCVLGM